jgi:hypothetical protein
MLSLSRLHSAGVKNHCPYITRPTSERIRAFRAVLIFTPSLAAHSQSGLEPDMADLEILLFFIFIYLNKKFAIIINRLNQID